MQFKLCSVFSNYWSHTWSKGSSGAFVKWCGLQKIMHGKRNTKGIFPSDTDVWTMEVFNYEQAILA